MNVQSERRSGGPGSLQTRWATRYLALVPPLLVLLSCSMRSAAPAPAAAVAASPTPLGPCRTDARACQAEVEAAPAAPVLTPRCSAGDAQACFALGLRSLDGVGGPPDEEAGLRLLEQACAADHAVACGVLSERLYWTPGERHLAQAELLLKKACTLGELSACTGLGVKLENGWWMAADPVRAATLYREACERGHATACANLGWVHHRGVGVQQDHAAALRWFERGCALGDWAGCGMLGLSYLRGTGVKTDPARGCEYVRRACAGDGAAHDPQACQVMRECVQGRPTACLPRGILDADVRGSALVVLAQSAGSPVLAEVSPQGQVRPLALPREDRWLRLRTGADGSLWLLGLQTLARLSEGRWSLYPLPRGHETELPTLVTLPAGGAAVLRRLEPPLSCTPQQAAHVGSAELERYYRDNVGSYAEYVPPQGEHLTLEARRSASAEELRTLGQAVDRITQALASRPEDAEALAQVARELGRRFTRGPLAGFEPSPQFKEQTARAPLGRWSRPFYGSGGAAGDIHFVRVDARASFRPRPLAALQEALRRNLEGMSKCPQGQELFVVTGSGALHRHVEPLLQLGPVFALGDAVYAAGARKLMLREGKVVARSALLDALAQQSGNPEPVSLGDRVLLSSARVVLDAQGREVGRFPTTQLGHRTAQSRVVSTWFDLNRASDLRLLEVDFAGKVLLSRHYALPELASAEQRGTAVPASDGAIWVVPPEGEGLYRFAQARPTLFVPAACSAGQEPAAP